MKALIIIILSTVTALSQVTNESIFKKQTNPIIYGDTFLLSSLIKKTIH